MSAVLRLLFRIVAVVLAFGLACLAGSVFVHFLVWGGMEQPDESREVVAVFSVFTIPFLTAWIGSRVLFAAMVLITVAEACSARDWLTYCLGGAAAALASVFVMPSGIDPSDAGMLAVTVATGLVGGWVYWFVAGSRAGRWREAYGSAALGHQDPDGES